MTSRTLSLITAAALLGAAGCGSDDEPEGRAATTSTSAGAQATATTDDPTTTTRDTRPGSSADGQLSPRGRAILDATQDLAADVSETAQEFARGRVTEDEAVARLELAGERAGDLRGRAQQLPEAKRAREELASLNEEISRTASDVSREVSSGRAASRDEISERIADLRDEAESTVDAIRSQLDRRAQERLREALERIGAETPG
jgi:hypothetical protein